MTAVIAELKTLAGKDDPARIVLFSQFPEMLAVIHKACRYVCSFWSSPIPLNCVFLVSDNGLREFVVYGRTNSGLAKSIEQFKSRAKKERFVILLLPVSKGAEGLNLTEANIIMLLEPAFPAALEQQVFL